MDCKGIIFCRIRLADETIKNEKGPQQEAFVLECFYD
mgnify:CR=1 FL=1|jgi:hypothetical protein